MMTKLKGHLFGKFVKQLFITSLISCFGLLGSSFVNGAYYERIGVSNSSPYDSNVLVSILPKGSFLSSMLGQGKPFLTLGNKIRGTSGKGAYAYYMWIDGRLYFYSSTYTTSTDSSVSNRQGFLTTYSICDYPDIQHTYLSNCESYTYNSTAINDFLTTVDTNEYYWFNSEISANLLVGAFCVSSTTYNKQLCFRSTDIASANLTGSLNFPSQMNFDSVDGYDSQSPAVPINPNPSPSYSGGTTVRINSGYTNGEIYDAFNELGYSDSICYSDFALDNIAVESGGLDQFFITDITEDGVSYTGATVYDLYGAYNQANQDILSWLNSKTIRYNQTLSNSNMLVNFYGKSKGLYYLFYKLDLYKTKIIDNFRYSDYISYCSLALSDFDRDGVYTGTVPPNVLTNINQIRNGQDSEDERYLFPPESSVFYNSGAFGPGSGAGGGGTTVATFRDLYDNIINGLHINPEDSGKTGILPSYIVIAFISFLLLYVLKR